MTNIDPGIELQHDIMSAYYTSGSRIVSDLYLYKNYRALLLELERQQEQATMWKAMYYAAIHNKGHAD